MLTREEQAEMVRWFRERDLPLIHAEADAAIALREAGLAVERKPNGCKTAWRKRHFRDTAELLRAGK